MLRRFFAWLTGAAASPKLQAQTDSLFPGEPIQEPGESEHMYRWRLSHYRWKIGYLPSPPAPSPYEAGIFDGRHFTEYSEQIKQLKREGAYFEAIDLTHRCIRAMESQQDWERQTYAPRWYNNLGILYRKVKDPKGEANAYARIAENYEKHGMDSSGFRESERKARAKLAGTRST